MSEGLCVEFSCAGRGLTMADPPSKESDCEFEFHSRLGFTTAYPKVYGLAAWSENCKWYSSLRLGAVVAPIL
jgi:hypothetical protein